MILSGLRLDPLAHAAATDLLADRLADLDGRRRAAEATVDSLLRGWHGEAATAFGEQWAAWSEAAASVVDQLGASVAALPRARADVTEADARSSAGAGLLQGRLG